MAERNSRNPRLVWGGMKKTTHRDMTGVGMPAEVDACPSCEKQTTFGFSGADRLAGWMDVLANSPRVGDPYVTSVRPCDDHVEAFNDHIGARGATRFAKTSEERRAARKASDKQAGW